MKNLKKVLSLALAFAMVLGLCVGAMAAEAKDITELADWADVTNKDAAQLLNALGIMQGDDKGNFNPAKNVTRAEATKMIAVALWGGESLEDLFKDSTTTFTDVTSADWFAGYVNYAAVYGIVSGKNPTTFDPKGSVTGYELLKMTLTALGYDQNIEGLVGTNWATRTMFLALQNGLTKGVEITNWNLPISRDNTAKVVANMINAKPVTYNTDDKLVKPAEESPTFGVQYFKLETKDGVVAANAYGMVNMFAGRTSVWDTKKSGVANADKGQNTVIRLKDNDGVLREDAKDSYVLCSTDSGLYDIGATATLYYKGTTLVSVVVDSPVELTPTATNKNDAVTAVKAGKDGHDVTKYFDTDGDGKYDLTNTISYVAPTTVAANTVADVVTSEKHGTVYVTGTAKWSSTYEKRASLSGLTGLLTDVVFVGDAAVKGDTIAYATTTNGNGETIKVAAVLENTTGAIDRVVTGTDKTVTYYIDGVAHKGANLAFNDKGTFYFFPDGYIAALVKDDGTSAGETHYAVIYKAGYTTSGSDTAIGGGVGTVAVQVAAILDNGENGTYNLIACGDTEVSKLTPSNVESTLFTGASAPLAGTFNKNEQQKDILVTYTLSDDGKSISVAPEKATSLSSSTAEAGSAKFGTDKYFTSTTVTFVSNGKDDTDETWAVYTGIPTFGYTATASAVLYDLYNKGDGIKAMVVDGYTPTGAQPDTSAFVYILENKGQTGEDSTIKDAIFTMTVYDAAAGTIGDVEVKGKAVDLNEVAAGDFCTSYTASTKTLDTKNPYKDASKGFVTTCGNGVVVLTTTSGTEEVTIGTTVYTYDTNTKFYLIDGENSEAITAADVTAQTVDTVGSDGKDYGVFYQAIVKATSGKADRVIIFADRQGTTSATR